MRVCFLSSFYGIITGGAEISVTLLAEALRNRGLDIIILTTRKRKGHVYPFIDSNTVSIPLSNFPRKVLVFGNKILDYFLSFNILRILRNKPPDLIHAHDIYITPAASIISRKMGIPLIVTVRDEMLPRLTVFGYQLPCFLHPRVTCYLKGPCNWKSYIRCMFIRGLREDPFMSLISPLRSLRYITIINDLRNAEHIISVSDFIKNELIKLGINKDKITRIYNPAPNWGDSSECKRKSSTILLFSAGRIEEEKGFGVLVRAMSYVLRMYENIRLVIAGDGPYLKELRRIVKALELNDYVKLIGKISYEKIKEWYLFSDIVIVPSIRPEPFGRVCVEAMITGKPVIASKVGGIPELVKNNYSGILVSPDDEEELGNAILLLLKDEERRRKFGENGRNEARIKFSPERIADETINLYNKVLNKSC